MKRKRYSLLPLHQNSWTSFLSSMSGAPGSLASPSMQKKIDFCSPTKGTNSRQLLSPGRFSPMTLSKQSVLDADTEKMKFNLKPWIERILGISFVSSASEFITAELRDGELLCRMLNILHPGTVANILEESSSDGLTYLRQCENICSFLRGAKSVGMKDDTLFAWTDLAKGENVKKVVHCLNALKVLVETSETGTFNMPVPLSPTYSPLTSPTAHSVLVLDTFGSMSASKPNRFAFDLGKVLSSKEVGTGAIAAVKTEALPTLSACEEVVLDATSPVSTAASGMLSSLSFSSALHSVSSAIKLIAKSASAVMFSPSKAKKELRFDEEIMMMTKAEEEAEAGVASVCTSGVGNISMTSDLQEAVISVPTVNVPSPARTYASSAGPQSVAAPISSRPPTLPLSPNFLVSASKARPPTAPTTPGVFSPLPKWGSVKASLTNDENTNGNGGSAASPGEVGTGTPSKKHFDKEKYLLDLKSRVSAVTQSLGSRSSPYTSPLRVMSPSQVNQALVLQVGAPSICLSSPTSQRSLEVGAAAASVSIAGTPTVDGVSFVESIVGQQSSSDKDGDATQSYREDDMNKFGHDSHCADDSRNEITLKKDIDSLINNDSSMEVDAIIHSELLGKVDAYSNNESGVHKDDEGNNDSMEVGEAADKEEKDDLEEGPFFPSSRASSRDTSVNILGGALFAAEEAQCNQTIVSLQQRVALLEGEVLAERKEKEYIEAYLQTEMIEKVKVEEVLMKEVITAKETVVSTRQRVQQELDALNLEMAVAGQKLLLAVQVAQKRLVKEETERRALLDKVLDLQGNIRVFCRIRPMSGTEAERGEQSVVIPQSESSLVLASGSEYIFGEDDKPFSSTFSAGSPSAPVPFEFDRVFASSSGQTEVFNEVKPLVQSALDGYNVCVFAYGQTGSGKTFTMEGASSTSTALSSSFNSPAGDMGCPGYPSGKETQVENDHTVSLSVSASQLDPNTGVNFRSLDYVFAYAQATQGRVAYSVSISVVEVYNEMVRDLLMEPKLYKESNGSHATKGLDVRLNPKTGTVSVPGLTEVPVSSTQEVAYLLRSRAAVNRKTDSTAMNSVSSRSHSLLFVHLHGKHKLTGADTYGRLVLIDLAGSERLKKSEAVGQSMKEAQHINKSLSALGDVIAALKNKEKHVPFRNSKLTFLLQDCLSGSGKCLMFCNVSPVDSSAQESSCTLKFAARVRNVQLGAAKKKEVASSTALSAMDKKEQEKEKERAVGVAVDRVEKVLQSEKALLAEENARLSEKLAELSREREKEGGVTQQLYDKVRILEERLQKSESIIHRTQTEALSQEVQELRPVPMEIPLGSVTLACPAITSTAVVVTATTAASSNSLSSHVLPPRTSSAKVPKPTSTVGAASVHISAPASSSTLANSTGFRNARASVRELKDNKERGMDAKDKRKRDIPAAKDVKEKAKQRKKEDGVEEEQKKKGKEKGIEADHTQEQVQLRHARFQREEEERQQREKERIELEVKLLIIHEEKQREDAVQRKQLEKVREEESRAKELERLAAAARAQEIERMEQERKEEERRDHEERERMEREIDEKKRRLAESREKLLEQERAFQVKMEQERIAKEEELKALEMKETTTTKEDVELPLLQSTASEHAPARSLSLSSVSMASSAVPILPTSASAISSTGAVKVSRATLTLEQLRERARKAVAMVGQSKTASISATTPFAPAPAVAFLTAAHAGGPLKRKSLEGAVHALATSTVSATSDLIFEGALGKQPAEVSHSPSTTTSQSSASGSNENTPPWKKVKAVEAVGPVLVNTLVVHVPSNNVVATDAAPSPAITPVNIPVTPVKAAPATDGTEEEMKEFDTTAETPQEAAGLPALPTPTVRVARPVYTPVASTPAASTVYSIASSEHSPVSPSNEKSGDAAVELAEGESAKSIARKRVRFGVVMLHSPLKDDYYATAPAVAIPSSETDVETETLSAEDYLNSRACRGFNAAAVMGNNTANAVNMMRFSFTGTTPARKNKAPDAGSSSSSSFSSSSSSISSSSAGAAAAAGVAAPIQGGLFHSFRPNFNTSASSLTPFKRPQHFASTGPTHVAGSSDRSSSPPTTATCAERPFSPSSSLSRSLSPSLLSSVEQAIDAATGSSSTSFAGAAPSSSSLGGAKRVILKKAKAGLGTPIRKTTASFSSLQKK